MEITAALSGDTQKLPRRIKEHLEFFAVFQNTYLHPAISRRTLQRQHCLKEKRSYWNILDEALDRTVCRTRFGRGCGPDVRYTAYRVIGG